MGEGRFAVGGEVSAPRVSGKLARMENMGTMWMVRAGEGGRLFEEWMREKCVAIGWEVGDLSELKREGALDELKGRLRAADPDWKGGRVDNAAGQIFRFRFEIEEGAPVVAYNVSTRLYRVGVVASPYRYAPDKEYQHQRGVEWNQSVSRDVLSPSARNSLGSILTIFKIPKEVADELLGDSLVASHAPLIDESSAEEAQAGELEVLKDDFAAKAREFTKDKLLSLDWEQMQELFAGILRAMGYKGFVSPRGADRGRDIVASSDGLGLEDPKIVVEVKHRKGQMGAPEMRSFLGGLRPGEKGVYVSTGGFTREARYEAERANHPLTLVDAERLVDLVGEFYDRFDIDTRVLIPLKKVYWPV